MITRTQVLKRKAVKRSMSQEYDRFHDRKHITNGELHFAQSCFYAGFKAGKRSTKLRK